jgi:hypothetical protein
MYPFVLLTKN